MKTNQSRDFYGPFKVAAPPTESDPPLAEWVSPIPLSGLFPTSVRDNKELFIYLEVYMRIH